MKRRFDRQSFLGPQSSEILGGCRVAVIGLGGGGSHVVQQLAHLGVGELVLFDHDRVEDHNLNRLVGATAADVGASAPKVTIADRLIHGVNPDARVVGVPQRWQDSGERLRDCDVVFGCVDDYAGRDEIERAARRFLIPYIDVGMDVVQSGDAFLISGQVMLSIPGGPCLWCMGFLREDVLDREAARYGAAGGQPQVVWPNGLLASAAVGIFVQLVTPWHREHRLVQFLEYEGNLQALVPSNKLAHLPSTCRHYPESADLGDPFWPSRADAQL